MISELTSKDETLFRTYVSRYRSSDNLAFEDSWAYVLQATRKKPIKYYDGHSLLLIEDRGEHLVIPNYFVNSLDCLLNILQGLNKKVLLKNVNPEDEKRLLQIGLRHYLNEEFWSEEARYDDQTFPQVVLSLDELLRMKGKNYSCLRNSVNHAKKNISEIILLPYDPTNHKNQVLSLAMQQDNERQEIVDSIIPYLNLRSNAFMKSIIFVDDKRVIGFSLIDTISISCMAFNALVYDVKIPGLSTLITVEASRYAKSLGYAFGNNQGSETQGLYNWKKKFNPCVEIERIHLVFNRK